MRLPGSLPRPISWRRCARPRPPGRIDRFCTNALPPGDGSPHGARPLPAPPTSGNNRIRSRAESSRLFPCLARRCGRRVAGPEVDHLLRCVGLHGLGLALHRSCGLAACGASDSIRRTEPHAHERVLGSPGIAHHSSPSVEPNVATSDIEARDAARRCRRAHSGVVQALHLVSLRPRASRIHASAPIGPLRQSRLPCRVPCRRPHRRYGGLPHRRRAPTLEPSGGMLTVIAPGSQA